MHTFDDIYPHQVVNASFDFQEGRTTEGWRNDTHDWLCHFARKYLYEDLG